MGVTSMLVKLIFTTPLRVLRSVPRVLETFYGVSDPSDNFCCLCDGLYIIRCVFLKVTSAVWG